MVPCRKPFDSGGEIPLRERQRVLLEASSPKYHWPILHTWKLPVSLARSGWVDALGMETGANRLKMHGLMYNW
jgi:hypothetical protein